MFLFSIKGQRASSPSTAPGSPLCQVRFWLNWAGQSLSLSLWSLPKMTKVSETPSVLLMTCLRSLKYKNTCPDSSFKLQRWLCVFSQTCLWRGLFVTKSRHMLPAPLAQQNIQYLIFRNVEVLSFCSFFPSLKKERNMSTVFNVFHGQTDW